MLIYKFLKTFIAPLVVRIFVKEIKNIENVPRTGAFIVASNHQSYLDPLIISSIFETKLNKRIYYLGKKELFENFLGRLFHNIVGTIPIDREKKGKGALKLALQSLKHNRIIAIFPEGTRSPDGKLQKGRTGVIRLALWAKAPILPVCIKGTFDIYPKGKTLPSIKKSAKVEFGKPINLSRFYKKIISKRLLRQITNSLMGDISLLLGK